MIADLKPYAEYKESVLPWLGKVPGHWELKRAKSSVSNVVEQTTQMNSGDVYVALENVESWTGRVRPQQGEHLFTGQVKRFRSEDVLFGKLRPYLAKVTRLQSGGVCVGELFVLRPRDACLRADFLEQQLRAKHIIDVVNSSTFGAKMPRADWQFLGNLPLVIPPPAEQAAIVRFLDWANGRLERTIRAKRRVIALLGEQKQAIIHRAVTRGIDPSVPLKPSGIPWLGDIPAHWEVRRVKQTTRILRGKFTHRPRNDPSLYDGPFPFIQTGVVAQASRFITGHTQTLNEKGLAVSKMFPRGTLVMTIAANIGEVAILTFDACFPDSIVGFVPSAGVDRDYLYMVFLCMKPELLRQAPVNTQGNLNLERIGAMGIPLPPVGEQAQIAKRAEAETMQFDMRIHRLEREIELLREYRTRLVADVVTGKLDVREAAARLPREAALDNNAPDLDAGLADEAAEA